MLHAQAARWQLMQPQTKCPAHTIRKIAVYAEADPRTVRRFLDGKTIRPCVRERIERALTLLGMALPANEG